MGGITDKLTAPTKKELNEKIRDWRRRCGRWIGTSGG